MEKERWTVGTFPSLWVKVDTAPMAAVRDVWKVVSGWGPVLEECAGDPPGKYKCGQASEEKREGEGKGEELKRIVKENVKR